VHRIFALGCLNIVVAPLRLDLTENQVYSRSDWHKQVLARKLMSDLISILFFSDKVSKT